MSLDSVHDAPAYKEALHMIESNRVRRVSHVLVLLASTVAWEGSVLAQTDNQAAPVGRRSGAGIGDARCNPARRCATGRSCRMRRRRHRRPRLRPVVVRAAAAAGTCATGARRSRSARSSRRRSTASPSSIRCTTRPRASTICRATAAIVHEPHAAGATAAIRRAQRPHAVWRAQLAPRVQAQGPGDRGHQELGAGRDGLPRQPAAGRNRTRWARRR